MNSDIRFYLSVFFRRLHYFVLVAAIFTAAGLATAIVLPTKYKADAILLVESPQIPDELAASTVRTNPQEQLQIIEQRLLTRPNLLEIARDNQVFSNIDDLFSDEIVTRMRNATTLRISAGRDRATLFTIEFEAEQPTTAAAVVNAYVTRVLEENIQLRTGRAEGTMEFFEQEVLRLGEDLSRKSAEILEFKNGNIDSLPENMTYQLSRLDDLRDRLSDIDREVSDLSRQSERLLLLSRTSAFSTAGQQDLRSPAQRELDDAEEQMSQLLTVYSEQNPRVRALRARIDSLRERVDAESESNDGEAAEAQVQPESLLDLQLSEIEDRSDLLKTERQNVAAEIEVLEGNIEAIPQNTVSLDALERDYRNIQDEYNRAVNASAAAATGERIELLSKGERITVLSQPVAPRTPSSPNRPLIAVAGAAFGVAAGLGLVILLELLNKSIRRPVDLVRTLGITPLATLPMMRTPREIMVRRGIVAGGIVGGAALVVAGIFYTHTQIMPIDLIAARAIDQMGL